MELVDFFFAEERITFRTVVIDSTKINNEVYNSDNQELGYYKFYYQLLYHWLSQQYKYRIYTDQKTNGDRMRLRELRNILNNSYNYMSPIESIQAINSGESVILQLENILMGAEGYKYNFGKNGKSKAKGQVVEKIEKHLKHEIRSTTKAETKFNVFEILEYCNKSPIATFDGLPVMFYQEMSEHSKSAMACLEMGIKKPLVIRPGSLKAFTHPKL